VRKLRGLARRSGIFKKRIQSVVGAARAQDITDDRADGSRQTHVFCHGGILTPGRVTHASPL